MKLKSYPKYRDSDIEWIGKVPEKWVVKRIKRMCRVRRGASPRPIDDPIYFDEEGEYGWVRISDVTASNKYLKTTEQRLSDYGKKFSVPLSPGRLFLSIAATVGVPIITKIKCCIHDGFVYFIGLKENPEYFYYLFSSGQLYAGLGKLGTQLNLNSDTVGMIFVPVPSANEQSSIVQYLNTEILKLQEIESRYRRAIALLNEKRIALITYAVTKGLNPKARMKDSDVDWFGEIPEHWEVKKIKHVSIVKISNVDKKSNPEEPDVLLCNYIDVYKNEFITSNMEFMKATANQGQINKLSIRKGDVLITKDSETPDDIAVPSLVKDELEGVVCGYHLAIIRPYKNVLDGEYLLRTLQAKNINTQFIVEANGVTRFGISTYPIENSIVLIPPISEQNDIALYINDKTETISKTIDKIQRQIDLLNEYKVSLISHAVTGKIDVRGYA